MSTLNPHGADYEPDGTHVQLSTGGQIFMIITVMIMLLGAAVLIVYYPYPYA